MPWQESLTVTTAAVLSGVGECVWGVAGSLWSACARGGVKGTTRVTRGSDALARPGLVAARSGASWAPLGTLGLARVLVLSVDDEHGLVQEKEGKWFDTVVHVGFGQREEWYGEVVSCHGIAMP